MHAFKRAILWIGAGGFALGGIAGCTAYSEGYYGEGALPASYYYGPGYYDPGYPYYYRIHDRDWREHDWHDGGRRDFSAERRGGDRAVTAGHREYGDGGGHGGRGDGDGHPAATAGGHIGGDRRY